VASEENFKRSREWIAECHNSHPACRGSNRSMLPSRVLKISDEGNSVRLIDAFDGKYAALSYCWGKEPQTIITTKRSLDQWKKDIPIQDLPQTIKDAIFTTYKLGILYLWVDSLCILQDSWDDQKMEIPRMSEIYHGAYVTISAACAEDCHQGFLHRRQPKIAAIPCAYTDGSLGILNLYQVFGVVPEPIHKRAWTLQEHVKSCRILEYGTQQLRRICRGDPDNAEILKHYDPAKGIWTIRMVPKMILTYWRRLVLDFTSRGIGHATDRPLAIHSIAMEYQRILNVKYLNGLWGGEFFSSELLWERDTSREPAQRPNMPHIPSWSWFSVQETINKWREWPSDYCDDNFRYRDASPGSCMLNVSGRLREAIWTVSRRFLLFPGRLEDQCVAETIADAVESAFDVSKPIIVTTLEILSKLSGGIAVGLVLSREANGHYRRLGLFWTSTECHYDVVQEWLSRFQNGDIVIV
ncbi:HET-domain-containing protein, partial [Periconia macrospinosa]